MISVVMHTEPSVDMDISVINKVKLANFSKSNSTPNSPTWKTKRMVTVLLYLSDLNHYCTRIISMENISLSFMLLKL